MRRRPQWPSTVMALLLVTGSGALGVTALVVTALPAGAAPPAPCGILQCQPPVGTVTPPKPADTVSPSVIHTVWTGVPSDAHIDQVQVTVTWDPQGAPAGAPTPDQTTFTTTPAACSTPKSSGGSQQCDVPWPAALESNGFVLNGQYSVSAVAVSCPTAGLLCSGQGSSPQTPFPVSTLPAAPANVTATPAKAPAAGVTVTWDPNPEPDVFGYAVYRVSGSQKTIVYGCAQSFAPAEVRGLARCEAKPSFTDAGSGGGQFSYQVIANRFGASYQLADQVRSPAGQSKGKVTVPGPPSATALVPAKSTGLTGLAGVFGSLKPRAGGTGFSTPFFGPAKAPVTTTDSGFNPALPYGQQPAPTDPPAIVSAPPPAPAKTHSSVGSIALVGAGVLVIVVALHGLWLRSEVKRSGPLEVLEPEM